MAQVVAPGPAAVPFPAVIEQEAARRVLYRAITSSRLAHAWLFVGPAGVGKRALAIELARVLNCQRPATESALITCDCSSCALMAKWQHPNLIPVLPLPPRKPDKGAAADGALAAILPQLAQNSYAPLRFAGSGQILIDEVRISAALGAPIYRLALTPALPGTRAVIVHPADRLNEEASNALLKLLEEPPDRTILILTVESPRNLLPTIVSRCQQLRFTWLSAESIAEALTRLRPGLDPERSRQIAALSQGSLTRALQLADKEADRRTGEGLEFLRYAVAGNAARTAETISKWTEQAVRGELEERLEFMGLWVTDALLVQAGSSSGQEVFAPRISAGDPSIARMAARYDSDQLRDALTAVEEARLALESNALPLLALTALAVNLKRILK